MFIFILANLPLPIILYLNWQIIAKYSRIHKFSRYTDIEKPRRLIAGWWLNNLSAIFVLIPVLSEQRIFVQDRHWLLSFATASIFSISGLLIMNSALGEELRDLKRQKA